MTYTLKKTDCSQLLALFFGGLIWSASVSGSTLYLNYSNGVLSGQVDNFDGWSRIYQSPWQVPLGSTFMGIGGQGFGWGLTSNAKAPWLTAGYEPTDAELYQWASTIVYTLQWGNDLLTPAFCNGNINFGVQVFIPHLRTQSKVMYHQSNGLRIVCNGRPPEPEPAVKCSASVAGDVAFGELKAEDINGRKASTKVRINCDKAAKARVKFMGRNGSDNFDLRSDIRGQLKVEGWSGNNGWSYSVNPGVPVDADVNVTLSANGTVTPGPFRSEGVVKIEIE